MRRSVGLATMMTAALTTSLVVLSAGSAAGGGCSGNATNTPDDRLFDPDSGWTGGGGDFTIAFGNTLVEGGQSKTFDVQWRNISNAVRTIRVRGSEFFKDPGMRLKILLDGENVTSRFRGEGNGLTFHGVAPGKRSPTIAVRFRNVTDETPAAGQGFVGFYKGSGGTDACDFASANANVGA